MNKGQFNKFKKHPYSLDANAQVYRLGDIQ